MESLSHVSRLVVFVALQFVAVILADDCQPATWSAKYLASDIVCRYQATTKAAVNYFTCTELAKYYDISLDDFFKLNPSIDRDCKSIKPNTEYCVQGYSQLPLAVDGFCGPNHGKQSCLGTDFQCCNGETWRCGNSTQDCAPGTCYSGACRGFPSVYSMNGKCGPKNGDKMCGGKWGDCCNFNGDCGTGSDFCGQGKCESGNCTASPTNTSGQDLPWQTGSTPDGTCGGSNGYTCDIVFGKCCSQGDVCGSLIEHCGTGCQSQFGKCNGVSGTAIPGPKPTPGSISPGGSCGGKAGFVCNGSTFGDCCSSYGFCGSTATHCANGCQPSFGTCPSGAANVSVDGTCGGDKGFTCAGSSMGGCCSSTGYCGTAASYCGEGCQKSFSSSCMTSNMPSSDGKCGPNGGYTCTGGPFNGQCCSSSGFCGTTSAYCGSGCQRGFGNCD